MREIKFRAWDESRNEMIYEFGAIGNDKPQLMTNEEGELFCGHYAPNGDWTEPKLMQYTGLKDSKKSENYEGNICKCVFNGIGTHVEEALTEVYYDETVGGFAHKVISKDSDYTVFGLNSKDLLYCEIIGNVFDNPELLTTPQGE